MRLGSGGVPARQRDDSKRPAVLGWVAAAPSGFLRFAVEPEKIEARASLMSLWAVRQPDGMNASFGCQLTNLG